MRRRPVKDVHVCGSMGSFEWQQRQRLSWVEEGSLLSADWTLIAHRAFRDYKYLSLAFWRSGIAVRKLSECMMPQFHPDGSANRFKWREKHSHVVWMMQWWALPVYMQISTTRCITRVIFGYGITTNTHCCEEHSLQRGSRYLYLSYWNIFFPTFPFWFFPPSL